MSSFFSSQFFLKKYGAKKGNCAFNFRGITGGGERNPRAAAALTPFGHSAARGA